MCAGGGGMSKVYVIRDWEENFEISQSKRIPDGKPLSYVPMPTKHDGKGLRRILRSEDALSMFGVWCLVVELAAKMNRRGVFADNDGPFDAEDIADSIGIDPEPVEKLLDLVTGGKINWIELIDWENELHSPRMNGAFSENSPSTTGAQTDEKRREERRREESSPCSPPVGNGPPLELVEENSNPGPRRRKAWSRKQLSEERYEAYPKFGEWWKLYPNGAGKRKAFEVWVKLELEFVDSKPLFEVLALQKNSAQWLEEAGKFVPHGATYLNQRMFEDDVKKNKNGGGDAPAGLRRFSHDD